MNNKINKCPKCGKETLPGDIFCGNCGFKLSGEQDFDSMYKEYETEEEPEVENEETEEAREEKVVSSKEPKQKEISWVYSLFGAILVFLIGVGIYYIVKMKTADRTVDNLDPNPPIEETDNKEPVDDGGDDFVDETDDNTEDDFVDETEDNTEDDFIDETDGSDDTDDFEEVD